jgi:hypothetical protein
VVSGVSLVGSWRWRWRSGDKGEGGTYLDVLVELVGYVLAWNPAA